MIKEILYIGPRLSDSIRCTYLRTLQVLDASCLLARKDARSVSRASRVTASRGVVASVSPRGNCNGAFRDRIRDHGCDANGPPKKAVLGARGSFARKIFRLSAVRHSLRKREKRDEWAARPANRTNPRPLRRCWGPLRRPNRSRNTKVRCDALSHLVSIEFCALFRVLVF
jgi:hypothetical protein